MARRNALARLQCGTPVAPRRGFFIGVAGPQDRRLIEQPAGDLQGKRQAARVEATAHRQGRIAADIERRGERCPREQARGRHRLELSGRLAGRQHQQVDRRQHRLQAARQLGPEPHRLDIVLGAHQAAGDDAVAQAGAEKLGTLAQIGAVDREQLGDRDDLLRIVELLERRQGHGAHAGAQAAEHIERRLEGRHGGGRGRRFVLQPLHGHADHQSLEVAGQGRRIVGDRHLGGARILRIMAGDDLQQDRHILGRPGERARHGRD